jgi:hypothetical protein
VNADMDWLQKRTPVVVEKSTIFPPSASGDLEPLSCGRTASVEDLVLDGLLLAKNRSREGGH